MLKKEVHMKFLKCLRCGYKWPPRVENPKKCPGCKSEYWNKPRKKKKEDGVAKT